MWYDYQRNNSPQEIKLHRNKHIEQSPYITISILIITCWSLDFLFIWFAIFLHILLYNIIENRKKNFQLRLASKKLQVDKDNNYIILILRHQMSNCTIKKVKNILNLKNIIQTLNSWKKTKRTHKKHSPVHEIRITNFSILTRIS